MAFHPDPPLQPTSDHIHVWTPWAGPTYDFFDPHVQVRECHLCGVREVREPKESDGG
jgi:hypothetical protein